MLFGLEKAHLLYVTHLTVINWFADVLQFFSISLIYLHNSFRELIEKSRKDNKFKYIR